MTKSLALSIAFAISALVSPASAGVIFFEDFSSGYTHGVSASSKPAHFGGTSRVLNDAGSAGIPAPNVRVGGSAGSSGNSLDNVLILHDVSLSGGTAPVTLSYNLRTGSYGTGANYSLAYQFYNGPGGAAADSWESLGSWQSSPGTEDGFKEAYADVVNGWIGTAITHQVSGTGQFVAFKWEYTGTDNRGGFRLDNLQVTAVPEPTSLAFAGIACGAAAFARRRHKKNSQKSTEATPETATA